MKEIQIGDQVWMAENLNVSHFQNGNTIAEVRTNEDWKKYGWHIPDDNEWIMLINHLGGFTLAGEKLAAINNSVKGLPLFYQTGFNALPGGYRKSDGFFGYLGKCGFWWSNTESIPESAWGNSCLFKKMPLCQTYLFNFRI